jgi:hypothetical protein
MEKIKQWIAIGSVIGKERQGLSIEKPVKADSATLWLRLRQT